MWVGGRRVLAERPEVFRDMLRFARRHGIVPYASGIRQPEDLARFLEEARRVGIEKTWIEVGPGKEMTVREFVQDSLRREPVLERFRALARTYREHAPDFARITLFDEAPLGAFASPGAGGPRSYLRDAALFREFGPEAFALLYGAIKEEAPHAEVGIFLHHPHNAPPEAAGEHSWIGDFMDRAGALGAAPDFIYSDIYRGYFARGYGTEATNAYVRDVVGHITGTARRHGVKAYQLGQIHTIKLGYTPGRHEIDTNVDAILDGGADGLGWYWPNYAATDHVDPGRSAGHHVSFDPFVPNAWGALRPAGSMFGTSRDRWVYGYLRALERAGRLEAAERFDLWLYGWDFDHAEHEVSLLTRDGEWEVLGRVNPQQDERAYADTSPPGEIYSYDGRWHAVLFRGLRRDRFLEADGTATLRVTTGDSSDDSELAAVYALPYRPTRTFLTEKEATRLVETRSRWVAVQSLARRVAPRPLELAAGSRVDVEVPGEPVGGVARDSLPPLPSGEFWKSQLETDLLSFWSHRGRTAHGLFHAFLDRAWEPFRNDHVYPGMVSRHLFSYAAGYMMTGREEYLEVADTLLAWLTEHGWDPEHGGWFNEVGSDGKVVDASKDLFMQLYAVTGLGMHWVVTHDPTALEYVRRTLHLLDEHAWDDEHGGYVRSLNRDLSVKEPGKSVSPQLAPLSGYLVYLYLATGDEAYLERAQGILDTVLARMTDPRTGWILEHFDEDWDHEPRPGRSRERISIGHQVETAWMALRLARLTGRDDYRQTALAFGDRLLERAFLPGPGVWVAELERADSTALGETVPWWVHAYGNMFQLALHGATEDPRNLDAFRRGAAFWNDRVVDPLHGGTFLSVDTAGRVVKGEKAVRTKTSYHAAEHALLNHLYTNLFVTGEPVDLHFRVEAPEEGEELRPLPVAAPASITGVEVNGEAWTDVHREGGFVRLPGGEPARLRVTLVPPEGQANPSHRFDLALHGTGLDFRRQVVELRRNPAYGEGWDTLAPGEAVTMPGRTTILYPDLSRHRYLGQDIREDHLRLRVTTAAGGELMAVYALPSASALPAAMEGRPGASAGPGPGSSGEPESPTPEEAGAEEAGEGPGSAEVLASLLERDPAGVEQASLAALIYPRPRSLRPGTPLVEHVEVPVRHLKPGELEVRWLEILYRYRN